MLQPLALYNTAKVCHYIVYAFQNMQASDVTYSKEEAAIAKVLSEPKLRKEARYRFSIKLFLT